MGYQRLFRWEKGVASRGKMAGVTFEMVAKAAIFGAGTLVAVSAPTSFALERARRFGVRLIAVARRDQALCFEGGNGEATGGLAA